MFRQIALYKMLWVNPRPQVAIKAVRFANPSRTGVPVLLGLTAVVPRDAKPPQAAAAVQKARDLLAAALKAVEDRQDAKAQGLLKDAIAADPTLTAAHQALADLCERASDEDAALATYQAWAKAGASTPLPYNRIGQILEKRKDYKAALEAYAKSLQIEWNQPPIIDAKARLEKLLKKK
jgi:Tfp pilus assembly protein PilF